MSPRSISEGSTDRVTTIIPGDSAGSIEPEVTVSDWNPNSTGSAVQATRTARNQR